MQRRKIVRRDLLKAGGVLAALAAIVPMLPTSAMAAWNKSAFEAKTVAEALKALGIEATANSPEVQIVAPDIAENGAVVPIQAVSKMADTQQLAVFIEKNPNVLAALIDISPDVLPDISTRVKMGQTSNVTVLAKAGGKYFLTTKEIKVTLGGCGG